MELQIITVIENMPGQDEKLKYEHGLSLYIEFDGHKILFDTGQTGAYLENAKVLHIPIEEVDTLIVSHGHYDHSGGILKTLPMLTPRTKMFVGDEFFQRKYKILEDNSYQYNGVNFTETDIVEHKVKLQRLSEDTTFISGNIFLMRNFPRTSRFENRNPKFYVKEGEDMRHDDFPDEIVLGLITTKGLVVVTGCSHIGIINILTEIKKRIQIPIYAVLGGTHLIEADQRRMMETVKALHDLEVETVAVSHCTGAAGIEVLEKEFGERFILNNTGNVVQI